MTELIQQLSAERVGWLEQEFAARAWAKPDGYFQKVYAAQDRGELVVLVAATGEALHGYLKIVWMPEYAPFRDAGIPEIQDLNVVPDSRRRGIATRLMDHAEAIVAVHSAVVGIAVGLHPGYGIAQRMYALRCYVPDGRPLEYKGKPVSEGQTVCLDDHLVMSLTKRLRRENDESRTTHAHESR